MPVIHTSSWCNVNRTTSRRITPATVLLVIAFGAAMFFSGRLWAWREVRDARRNAGEAERLRIEAQRQLDETRNQLLLHRKE